MNDITPMKEQELISVLQNSLYPGAAPQSVVMVLGYCKASGLDPMQKPVHIVPIWDAKAGQMRDVVMPGIGLYRTQAARSGNYAGVTEPEFGPDVTENIDGTQITYPAWCKVIVKRALQNGTIVDFAATERWKENYAQRGGKEKSIAPNAMWQRRPYAQLAKCSEAQALRKAFPEFCSALTAEEMEGKDMNERDITPPAPARSNAASRDIMSLGKPKAVEQAQEPNETPDQSSDMDLVKFFKQAIDTCHNLDILEVCGNDISENEDLKLRPASELAEIRGHYAAKMKSLKAESQPK